MKISFKQIIAAFFLIGGTFLMLILGTWQLQRLEWKQGIIAQLNRGYEQAGNAPILSLDSIEKSQNDILYGRITGHLLYDKELFLGPKTHNGKIGHHILTPLETSSGIIFVNRGWLVDKSDKYAISIYPNEKITITGTIRTPDWNRFTPNNNPETNVWTKLDVKQMAEFLDLENVSPKIIYLDHAIIENDPVIAVHQKWYPRNKHKQYAIFWFSMAFIFLGFFVFYMRAQKNKLN